MALNTLKDVYIDQLQDLYSANKQAYAATAKLIDAAHDEKLVQILKRSSDGIERGIDTVELIAKSHDANPNGEFCKGMEGLVKEINAHVTDAEFGDEAVRDAMIITQAQRMTHYALAGYGCVAAFAKRLGLKEDQIKLKTELDNLYTGDRDLSEIAEDEVNAEAAAA